MNNEAQLTAIWWDLCDIGQFLMESACDSAEAEMALNYTEAEYAELGDYFTKNVFGGNLGEAYEYSINLKPYNYECS